MFTTGTSLAAQVFLNETSDCTPHWFISKNVSWLEAVSSIT